MTIMRIPVDSVQTNHWMFRFAADYGLGRTLQGIDHVGSLARWHGRFFFVDRVASAAGVCTTGDDGRETSEREIWGRWSCDSDVDR